MVYIAAVKPRRLLLAIAGFALSVRAADVQILTVKSISVESSVVVVIADLHGKPTQLTCQISLPSCSQPQPGEYSMRPATADEAIYQDCTNVVLLKTSTASKEQIGVYCWLNAVDCYLLRCSTQRVDTIPAVVADTASEGALSQQGSKKHAILVTFSQPVYPPLAKQANIYGDVSVAVTVRADGKTGVALERGHPMLAKAALDSAKATRFECQACDADVPYQLLYSFRLVRGNDCCSAWSVPAKVTLEPESRGEDGRQAQQITIETEEVCLCDPPAQLTKKTHRSLKCLYLWSCSYQ